MRCLAIGDIHGCFDALTTLVSTSCRYGSRQLKLAVECGPVKQEMAMIDNSDGPHGNGLGNRLDGHFGLQFAMMTGLAFYGSFFWNPVVWAIVMGTILTLGFGYFISRFVLNVEGPPAKLAISSIACGTTVMFGLWLAYHFST